jgi:membrane-associated protease RseP (regulator of RpoE activity)
VDESAIVEIEPEEEQWEWEPPRERWWLHGLLFAITLLSMTVAGVTIAGHGFAWSMLSPGTLRLGLSFSLPVAAILLAHESGHYFAARRYRVDASPPYFIPFWPDWNLLGTLGAFIRIRSPIFDRRTLFDIGIAGPLAGMAVALPVLFLGVALSAPSMIAGRPLADQIIVWGGSPLYFGDSIIMSAARAVAGVHGPLLLHPVAVAGWVGLLVTSLNLLPLAQFDGGHILYAMSGRAQRLTAIYVWISLLGFGFLWPGWWLWAVVALAVGRGRLSHPEVLAPAIPLDKRRMILGWVAIAIFVITFAPMPIAG